jgi:hypothetical protein
MSLPRDITAENILERLSDLTNNPHEETLVPYREFDVDGKLSTTSPLVGFSTAESRGPTRWGDSFAATSPMKSGTTGATTGKQ